MPGPLPPYEYRNPRLGPQQFRPPQITPDTPSRGILGLFGNPQAGQLGWLLPLALFSLILILVPLITDRGYRRPGAMLARLRASPALSQSILWGGWLATAVVVFGLADATTTHTYYLVGVAVPLAAVTGAGLSVLWRAFRRGAMTAWLLPAVLLGAALYQIFQSRDLVGVWAIAIPAALLVAAIPVMAFTIWKKRTVGKPAAACVAAGALSLLVIPLAFAVSVGDRIVGPASALQYSPPPSIIEAREERLEKIPSFIDTQNDAGSVFTLGTVNARDAAPFIINGVPTVAIGGFTGIDPIFTVESFRDMAERGELRYFFITSFIGPSPDLRAQDDILRYITASWEDVSRAAGLRPGTLYRYTG